MGKVSLYGQPRGTTNLTIVAMVGILLWWMALVDDAGVAAYNDDSHSFRNYGPDWRIIIEMGGVPDTATANCRAACEACHTCCSSQETSTPRPSGGEIEKKRGSEQGRSTIVQGRCGDPRILAELFYNATNVIRAEGDKFLVYFFPRCTFAERRGVIERYRKKFGQKMSEAWIKRIRKCRGRYIASAAILEDTMADSLVKVMEIMITAQDLSLERDVLWMLIESSDSDPIPAAIRSNEPVYSKIKLIVSTESKYDGKFWRILDSQLNGTRSSSASVDETRACEDAGKIREAIESQKWTDDDNDFHRILMTTGYPQLRKVLEYYKALGGRPLEAAINETFTPPVAKAYNDILRYAESKTEYFLKNTKNSQYLVLTLWRSEIDLVEIKEAYLRMYNTSFSDSLKNNPKFQTHCDLEKNVWLAIIGE